MAASHLLHVFILAKQEDKSADREGGSQKGFSFFLLYSQISMRDTGVYIPTVKQINACVC